MIIQVNTYSCLQNFEILLDHRDKHLQLFTKFLKFYLVFFYLIISFHQFISSFCLINCLKLITMSESGDHGSKSESEGATGGTPDRIFKDDATELIYWRQLALNLKEGKRKLSGQLESDRVMSDAVKEELNELRSQVAKLKLENKSDGFGVGRSDGYDRSRSSVENFDVIPKLTFFNARDGEKEYPYHSWRFDVKQLMRSGYPPGSVRLAIVRSCRGTPADILQSLGENFHPNDVLEAFDKRFASVATAETLLATFYSTSQKAEECVNAWGCRLESLLSKPQLCSLAYAQKQSMLRERFWRGLRADSIRNSLRYKFDSGAHYEDLLVCAREMESENKTDPSKANKATHKSRKSSIASLQSTDSSSSGKSTDSSLSSKIDEILARLTVLENKISKSSSSKSQNPKGGKKSVANFQEKEKGQVKEVKKLICYNCGEEGHFRNKCPLNNLKAK